MPSTVITLLLSNQAQVTSAETLAATAASPASEATYGLHAEVYPGAAPVAAAAPVPTPPAVGGGKGAGGPPSAAVQAVQTGPGDCSATGRQSGQGKTHGFQHASADGDGPADATENASCL